MTYKGCKYADENRKYRNPREDSYSDQSPYIISKLREPISKSFQLNESQDLTFNQIFDYSDILLSESFEGAPKRIQFKIDEWDAVRKTQTIKNLGGFDDYAR